MVEIMIVVLVLAIIGALVVPMHSDADVTRLRAAARLMAADLDYVQIESITHSDDPRALVVDQANNRYRIAAMSDTSTPITHPIDHGPYQVEFGLGRAHQMAGVTIVNYDLDGDEELSFGAYGNPDQTNDATVTLGIGAYTVTLTIDAVTGATTVGDLQP